jgi:S-DNA-T family DNA segregation ATPase FtsK/SpoIIIE
MFAQAKAPNFSMYNEVAEDKLDAIIVVVDNFDVVKELGYDAEEVFTKLTRDGTGLGIYTVISATRPGAVKYAMQNNFKNKLVHYLFDESDVITALGRPTYKIGEVPGRAYVKQDNINVMQVYSPVDYENDMDYARKVTEYIGKIDSLYTGARKAGIAMLPDTLYKEDIPNYEPKIHAQNLVAVGLNADTVKKEFIDLNAGMVLIVGGSQSGKTNALKLVASAIKDTASLTLFDSKSLELYDVKDELGGIYVDSEDAVKSWYGVILKEIADRNDAYQKSKESGKVLPPRQFFASLPRWIVLVEDVDNYIEMLKCVPPTETETLIPDAQYVGITFIATSAPNRMKGYDNITKQFKDCTNAIVMGNPNDQTILPCSHMRSVREGTEFGFIYDKGNIKQIQIPRY